MNLENILKKRILALADTDDQDAVCRFAADLRRMVKKGRVEKTPFLTLRIHEVLVAFAVTLRAERQMLAPDTSDAEEPATAASKTRSAKSPEDVAFERWHKVSDFLQKKTEDLEKILGTQRKSAEMGIADVYAALVGDDKDLLDEVLRESIVDDNDRPVYMAPGDDHTAMYEACHANAMAVAAEAPTLDGLDAIVEPEAIALAGCAT